MAWSRYESQAGEFLNTIKALGALKGKVTIKIRPALLKCAEVILNKSHQYVPVDTGELMHKSAARVHGEGRGAKATVIYWAKYAVYVHEDMSKYHKAPTQAKFLERAVRETRGTCASIIKRELEIR